MQKALGLLFCMLFSNVLNLYSADTLCINHIDNEFSIYKYVAILEDSTSRYTIDSFLTNSSLIKFQQNNSAIKLNFEFSTSTYWIKLLVKNMTAVSANYILEVSNPDLDYINFYEIINDSVTRKIETGELKDVKLSREIYHRYFLFNIILEPGKTYLFYISANNGGHSFFIPLKFEQRTYFEKTNNKDERINWLLYGLFVFVIIFNTYLYTITKDRVNLYYPLYVFFALMTLVYYDGYFYLFNPPVFVEKIKWIIPSLYIVFLLSFTQVFTSYNTKFRWLKRFLNPFKIISVACVAFYTLKYPLSLIADLGIPILILASLILIIFISYSALRKDYSPSIILFIAYSSIFLGFFINELKEFNILSSNFFVENSSKFGQTLECILLTIAVLERFRINQEDSKKTIEKSYSRIEIQNKELEIINTELEKLSIVASETNNSVAIYDNYGRLEWCNSGFEKFYKSNIDDLIKKGLDHIHDILPNPQIMDLMSSCITEKKPISFETLVKIERNKAKWVQTTLSPYVRSGKIKKVIAIDSDISDLKDYEKNLNEAKEKAFEANRLKSVFLANMSHEIRTPLNGILGFGDLIQNQNITTEKRGRYLEIINSNSHQLLKIIDDIMDISMIESNQLKVNKINFNLSNLFPDAVVFFNNFMRIQNKEHIELILEGFPPSANDRVYSDPTRLQQILYNLLSNSIKFTEKGLVKFGGKNEDKFTLIYVEDTGIGIQSKIRKVIFTAFRQGEETITRSYGGTGLGLSISKGIVELLDGMIWVDYSYQRGTLFCFSIPADEITPDSNTYTHLKDFSVLNKKNLLIVDDNNQESSFIADTFKDYRANISWIKYENLQPESIEIKPDLIVFDSDKDAADIHQSLSQLEIAFRDIPLMALVTDSYYYQTGLNKHPDIYSLAKPVNIQLMLIKCAEFLSKKKH